MTDHLWSISKQLNHGCSCRGGYLSLLGSVYYDEVLRGFCVFSVALGTRCGRWLPSIDSITPITVRYRGSWIGDPMNITEDLNALNRSILISYIPSLNTGNTFMQHSILFCPSKLTTVLCFSLVVHVDPLSSCAAGALTSASVISSNYTSILAT